MPKARAAALLAVALLTTGCGPRTAADGPAGEPSPGGDVPTTPGALAFVAAEYAGTPEAGAPDDDVTDELKGGIGAVLRFGSTGEYDGDLLAVGVGTGFKEPEDFGCDAEYLAGCEQTEQGLLLWEDVAPEEDPGYVVVIVEKGDTTVAVLNAGPDISGDPRDLDLPISVDDMFAIANDARVDLTTSQAAVDAGEDLDYWLE